MATAAAAAAEGREGHVSRARLFGEGSVLARRLQEQRQQQQQQQQQLGQEADEQYHDQQPAQITWPELWDARWGCSCVLLIMVGTPNVL